MAHSLKTLEAQLKCGSTRDDNSKLDMSTKKTYIYPAEGILPPCKVCGDRASGYHFGAVTCEACKAFFSRSVRRTKDYVCRSKTKKCVVTFEVKPICPYCRLQKCRYISMSKEGTRMGRYDAEYRTNFILLAKSSKDRDSEITKTHVEPRVDAGINTRYDDIIGRATQAYLNNQLYSADMLADIPDKLAQKKEEQLLKDSLFGSLRTLPTDVYLEVSSTGLDVDESMVRLTQCLGNVETDYLKYINMWREFPGYQQLELTDKCIMTRDNSFLWFLLAHLPGLFEEERLYVCPSCSRVFTFNELYGYSQELEESICATTKKLKDLHLTEVELSLLMAIAYLCTDDLQEQVTDQAAINALSDEYVEVLVYHVTRTRPPGDNIIPRIVEALTKMKSCAQSNRIHMQEKIKRLKHFNFHISDAIPELVKEMKGLNLTKP